MIRCMFQEHLLNLQIVFLWFWEACLKHNPEKCQLLQREVLYLRHIVSLERISADPKNFKTCNNNQPQKITLYIAEINCCVTRWELLVILRTMEHFHKYMHGQEFHLRTDHSALTWLMSFENLDGQTLCCICTCKNTTLLPNTVKAGNTTMLMLFHDNPARCVPIAIKSTWVQISSKYELLQVQPQPARIQRLWEWNN